MRIAAIVLAAGEGARMGGPKALLPLAAESFLSSVCRTLRAAGVDRVVAVLGADAERVRRETGIERTADVVVNRRWAEGMLSSVLCGLDAAIAGGAEALLIHPVDHPFVATQTVLALCASLEAGARICVPTHAGRRGHPAAFSSVTFATLRAAPADEGVRGVLRLHADWIVHVPCGEDCLREIDTWDDYRREIGEPVVVNSPAFPRGPSKNP